VAECRDRVDVVDAEPGPERHPQRAGGTWSSSPASTRKSPGTGPSRSRP
jgi:hypothetical protein